jgi:ribosomal protein S27AE
MPETYSSPSDPLIASQRRHCPKCDTRMHLAHVAHGSSNFDVRTFDCAKCDHTYIVTVAMDQESDSRSLHARAIDALEEAQAMSPGTQRNEALKKAGLLRRTSDNQGVVFAKRGRPRK